MVISLSEELKKGKLLKYCTFSSLTTSWLCSPQIWCNRMSQNTLLPFRAMRFEVMGTLPQPVKCSRNWSGIPDTGWGKQFTLGYLVWTNDISLQKSSRSFSKSTLLFRATPKLTVHPWIDPDWGLYRTGLNPRVALGKTRKPPTSS